MLASGNGEWAPWSEVMAAGTPKWLIQWWKRAEAQAEVGVEATGIASGHRLDRSMMVKRCVKPFDIGNGTTKLMLMCANRWAGTRIVAGGSWA
jgi:hypothetical protein